ncbi:MAG: AbrB/MazE/SpoVT family DNA-binding domain-containing protein [Fluviicoccus sp.]|uniref:AbrB/MazE/SpoVT family DNA-binding domain-containing protein n=1 Tax=Fluviicoccus sp. TaxID=2003552 RepID=UPI002720D6C2|nr:AbrB/MazE/SpoVT family DNA-binding domain-containing protein [Fluviicoccus sp.]MDO8332074.1 AbrB/MazE/SpoVT family DNA-binding domain-containing protein [Fluviicoccus sp.]
MSLQITKWGNSLAVRLPSALIRQTGWHAGDEIDVTVTAEGEVILKPAAASTNVRAGLGMLAGTKRETIADDDPDAKLLKLIRDQDRDTHA